jgi:hypothetical protein
MERKRRRKSLLVISRCSIYDLPLFYPKNEFCLDDDSSYHIGQAATHVLHTMTYGDAVSIVNDARAPLSPFLLMMLLWKVQLKTK